MIGRFLKGRKAWKHRGTEGTEIQKGRKAWKHRGTDGTEIQKGRKAWKHGGTRGHGVTCSPSPPSSLPVFSHRLFSHRLFSLRLFSLRALWASVFQKKVQRVCERVRARVWSIRVSPARLAQGLLRVPVCLLKLRAMRRLGYRLGPWRLQARSRASLPRRR